MPRETTSPGKGTPLVNRFNAGELSPRHDARADASRFAPYKSGCRTMENFVPLLQGGARRMPGTEYISSLPALQEPEVDIIGFIPYDMTIDERYVYVCGKAAYSNGTYFAGVRKYEKGALTLLASYNVQGTATTAGDNYFMGIRYHEGYIYAVGQIWNTAPADNNGLSIIVKLDCDDLSEVWQATKDHNLNPDNDYDCGYNVICDDDYAYWVGYHTYNQTANRGFVQKTDISDGSEIWSNSSVYSFYFDVVESGSNVVVTGTKGGTRFLHVVAKSNGATTEYVQSDIVPKVWEGFTQYYLHYGMALQGSYIYIAGLAEFGATDHSTTALALQVSDITKQSWLFEEHFHHDVDGWENPYGIAVTDEASPTIFLVGSITHGEDYPPNYTHQMYIVSLTSAGAKNWDIVHTDAARTVYQAVQVDDNFLWVATYDTTPGINKWEQVGKIEKRSLETGAIITEFYLPG